jgi:uncharacterized protein (TIGR02147 family)
MTEIAEILRSELKARQELNSAYSLRSFARFLDISPATVSQVISEKRSLGRKSQERVLNKLGYKGESFLNELPRKQPKTSSVKLEDDIFELIGKWYYFAILSLSEVEGSRADSRWIASRLGITVTEANSAMTRLSRLKIIEIRDDGSFYQSSPAIVTSDEVPSSAIQEYHKSILKLAQLKIEQVPVDKREFRSVTIAGNSKKIKKAKKIIKELKDMVVDSLETGSRDEVYQLSIQLFPLKKSEN